MSRKRKNVAPVAPVDPNTWSQDDYRLIRWHARRKLQAAGVEPRHIADLIDESIGLAWASWSDAAKRAKSEVRYSTWRARAIVSMTTALDHRIRSMDTAFDRRVLSRPADRADVLIARYVTARQAIISKANDRIARLRAADSRRGVIKGFLSIAVRSALRGGRLADTRPHRQYRDAWGAGYSRRVGIEDGLDRVQRLCQDGDGHLGRRVAYLEEIAIAPEDPAEAGKDDQPGTTMVPLADIFPTLSNADRAFLRMLSRGWSDRAIAHKLLIARKTVTAKRRAIIGRIQAIADEREESYRSPDRPRLPLTGAGRQEPSPWTSYERMLIGLPPTSIAPTLYGTMPDQD